MASACTVIPSTAANSRLGASPAADAPGQPVDDVAVGAVELGRERRVARGEPDEREPDQRLLAALLVERHRLLEDRGGGRVARRADALARALAGEPEGEHEQVLARGQVVAQRARGPARLGGDVADRHPLGAARADDAPDGGRELAAALVVVDDLRHVFYFRTYVLKREDAVRRHRRLRDRLLVPPRRRPVRPLRARSPAASAAMLLAAASTDLVVLLVAALDLAGGAAAQSLARLRRPRRRLLGRLRPPPRRDRRPLRPAPPRS